MLASTIGNTGKKPIDFLLTLQIKWQFVFITVTGRGHGSAHM
jgi:hypothetical protein